MLLKIGYDLTYQHNEFTPVVLMLEVHPSRLDDLLSLDVPRTTPIFRWTATMIASAIDVAELWPLRAMSAFFRR